MSRLEGYGEEDDHIPPSSSLSYRDRAAERRKQDDGIIETTAVKKGLDFSLLDLQKKGLSAIELVQSNDGRMKLVSKAIHHLYPEKKPITNGWKLNLHYQSTLLPQPIYMEESSTEFLKKENNAMIMTRDDIELVQKLFPSKLVNEKKTSLLQRTKVANFDEREDDEEEQVNREIDELSDDGDQKNPIKPSNTVKEEEDTDDDIFPHVGNEYLEMAKSNLVATSQIEQTTQEDNIRKEEVRLSKKEKGIAKSFDSLTIEELKELLSRIEQAMNLKREQIVDNILGQA